MGSEMCIRDRILPASATGAESTSILTGSRGIHDPNKVYVTTSFEAAVMFAAGHDHGCVYEVSPVNPRPDPDCSELGLAWECDSAAVIRRHRIRGKALKLARRALLDEAA